MASIFTDIKNAEHSTAAWLEKTLTAMEGKAPTIEKMADAVLEYVGPALQIGLSAINEPALSAAVGTIVTDARTKLAAASALLADFGPSPTVASIYTTVAGNLSTALTTLAIKNTKTIATITKAVSEVGIVGSAVSAAAAGIEVAAAASAPPATA